MSSCSYHASKDAVGTCVSCGKLICRACHSEIDGKSYCPPCVEKLFTTSQAGAQATPALAAAKPVGQAVNPAWWLLPVFLSWVGGLAAWLANKERNASMAQYMLFTGIGIAVVQGLVGLTLVIVLMAPSAARPGQNPLATPTLPQATNPVPPAGTGGISTGPSTPAVTQSPAASSTNPSPLTSAEQPPDFKAQEAKIDEVVGQLCTAFKAKDAEGALKYFQTEERDKYRKIFSQFPDLLPEIAAELEMAKINFLSFKSDQYSRTAEYLIRSDGQDFSIVFIDVEGQWMLKKF